MQSQQLYSDTDPALFPGDIAESPAVPGGIPNRFLDRDLGQWDPHVCEDSQLSPSTDQSLRIALPVVVTLSLQEWEGHVVEIGDTDFTAGLVDITRGEEHESVQAVIPLKELSEENAASLSLGKIFRWVIGYEYSLAGEKTTVSHIVFRDLPRITEEDLEEAQEWAREIGDWLKS